MPAERRARASVRLWQTELFIVVIVVAILILSASLSAGLQRTLTDQGTGVQVRNATLLATQLAPDVPVSADTLSHLQSTVESFARIYGDSVRVYDTNGQLLHSTGSLVPPTDVLGHAREQALTSPTGFSAMDLSSGGFVTASKAVLGAHKRPEAIVVVTGSVASELAVLDAVRTRLWTTFWVALIVAGALGFAFSEFIGRRVRAMSQAAIAIAAGDFSQRLPIGMVPDEIRDLAESYNRMAARLGEAFSAVHEREREMTAVVESMAEGVIAFGRDGTVRVINAEAKRLLDDPDVDLVGAPASAITADAVVLDAVSAGLEGHGVAAVAQLGERTTLLHCTPLLDDAGAAIGAVLLLSDVTEQKRLEDAQRRFVANASHEMRTPIAALKGLLELLEDGAKDDPKVRDDFMRTMGLEVDRLGRLVADLLTLAQLEAGTFTLDLQPESAQAILERVSGVMCALAEKAGVDLAVDLPDGDLSVLADRDRVIQVLLGFTDNALKHSKRGDRIRVSARREGTAATFEVADHGPGVPADVVPRLFDRFYRADEARSGVKGAGLGLSIAKEIAEAHASSIGVSETPGGGATFAITLPLAE